MPRTTGSGFASSSFLNSADIRELAAVRRAIASAFHGTTQTILIGGEIFSERAGAIIDPILSFRDDPIAISPAADDIVVLQGEAGRVDARVAAGTRFVGSMFGELLADGRGAADIGLDGGHIRRRRRRRLAQDAVEHPRAAHHGACRSAIGRDLEDACMREHAAAMMLRLERHFAERHPMHVRDAVVARQSPVEHRKVRVDEVPHAQVFFQQFVEKLDASPRTDDHCRSSSNSG